MADIQPYLDLVTSQNNDKPKYMGMLSVLLQGAASNEELIASMIAKFDLDLAVGAQLDVVGEWVGRSRYLSIPLVGVYFSFDISGVGFDEGVWQGPFDPTNGLTALPDDAYRTLLRAVIAANQWDGSIPAAYAAWDIVFAGTGSWIIIIDHQDMTMSFGLLGPTPDAVTLALLTGGYLALKPAGVRIVEYLIPTVPDTPFFGFDIQTDSINGFDIGSWSQTISS